MSLSSRLGPSFSLLALLVVACEPPVTQPDRLGDGTTDTPKKTSKTDDTTKTQPTPSTETPVPSTAPAPPPAPSADQPPTLTAVTPDSIGVGSSATGLDVTLAGTGFPSNVQINLAGTKLPGTFVSPQQVTVHIPPDQIKTSGTLRLSVVGKVGESNALSFTVANPTSTSIATLTPASTILGTTGAVALAVTGTGFTAQSVVKFNGAALPTTFTSATQLATSIPDSAFIDAGRVSVTVALGTDVMSLPFAFEVRNPAPTSTASSPSSVPSGIAATVTITGTGFTKGSSVLAGTQAISTTYVNATSIRAVVPASILSTSGNVMLSVQNGAPGGGTSTAVALAVTTAAASSSSSSSGGAATTQAACAYTCADYGYAPGQCYADYYCITTGTYAGCLGQADCGDATAAASTASGSSGASAATCTYKCTDYGYQPGDCVDDWYCISSGTYAGCLTQTICGD